MNSFFLEEYARQRQTDIAQDFARIHAAETVRNHQNRKPVLFRIGQMLTKLGNRLQEQYAVPEVIHE